MGTVTCHGRVTCHERFACRGAPARHSAWRTPGSWFMNRAVNRVNHPEKHLCRRRCRRIGAGDVSQMGNVLKCMRVKLLQQRRSQPRFCCSAPAAAVAQNYGSGCTSGPDAFPTINRLALPGQAAVCRASRDVSGRRDRSRLARRTRTDFDENRLINAMSVFGGFLYNLFHALRPPRIIARAHKAPP
jgi:hypothetical protein